jgi:hypothetical protein
MVAKRTETITTSSTEYAITGNWSHIEVTSVDGAGYVTIAPTGTAAVSLADEMDVLPAAPGASLVINCRGKSALQTLAFIANASTIVHIRGVNL